MKPIRIGVLDDHPIIGSGLANYFGQSGDLRIVVHEQQADSFIERLESEPCDAAIVDFRLPASQLDGTRLVSRLRARFPRMALVVYSASRASEVELQAMRAGANAFLEKQHPLSLLALAVRASVAVPLAFFGVRDGELAQVSPTSVEETLTSSEVEVLRHIAEGLSVTQVAKRVNRSVKTVSTHKRRAMTKLSLPDDLSLAIYLERRFR